jgi:hypothetical protein
VHRSRSDHTIGLQSGCQSAVNSDKRPSCELPSERHDTTPRAFVVFTFGGRDAGALRLGHNDPFGSVASHPDVRDARGMSAMPLIATQSVRRNEASRCAKTGLTHRNKAELPHSTILWPASAVVHDPTRTCASISMRCAQKSYSK